MEPNFFSMNFCLFSTCISNLKWSPCFCFCLCSLKVRGKKNFIYFTINNFLFLVEASDPDRTTLFQKISIPKFTWNWATTNTRPKIKNLLDCGSQCSISNYNTLLYNENTSACILAIVRYLKLHVELMLIQSF